MPRRIEYVDTKSSAVAVEVALIVRLLNAGEIRESKRALPIIERMSRARWISRSSRAGIWLVLASEVPSLTDRLSALLPSWQTDLQLLGTLGLDPFDPYVIQNIAALRTTPAVTGLLHRKSWNAATAAGSKIPSRISSGATLTDDWNLRGRCNCALRLRMPQGHVDLEEQTRVQTEFSIPERGWIQSQGFFGALPRAVITVENVGPFVDLVLPEATVVLYSQGNAVQGAAAVVRALPSAIWIHFADLDSAGVDAGRKISKLSQRPLIAFVPSFVEEYAHRSLPATRTWSRPLFDHPFIRVLAEQNRWMEQEVFILDDRLTADLAAAIGPGGDL